MASPPAPWLSWDDVRRVRETLNRHRFLLMRRPEQVKDEERGVAEALLSSPVGTALQTIYSFLLDWYGLWTDDAGNRRTLDEAYTYYTAWRSNPDCQGLPALRRAQERVTEAKLECVSQFLRHPGWEATSNGMERGGRAFRHRQSPHFKLRSAATIERAVVIAAMRKKEKAMRPQVTVVNPCARGRKPKVMSVA